MKAAQIKKYTKEIKVSVNEVLFPSPMKMKLL